MRSTALALAAACAALSLSVLAQEPPARAARISYIEGPASVYQDPDAGWQEALLNIPLTSENSVWTDRGARAEIQVGASAIRLASLTQLDISRLDDDEMGATVASGRISLRVRYPQPRERYDLSTPSAAFEVSRDGLYRLSYDPESDESRFTVVTGDARMHGDGGDVAIGPGRTVIVYGGDSPSYDIFAAERADSFDSWVQARDARWHPPRYVSAYMTGYQDLEAYGTWSSDPDYGDIWVPTRVDSDWAPYRDGRWAYVEPWGWTWVDAAPWGYAPFHYGRWVQVHDRWAWSPGRRVERPTWAPALVAWIGLAGGSSGGSVGWYPLAPWERYRPWYRADSRYTERVNQVVVRDKPPQNVQVRGEQAVQANRDRGATVVQRNAMVTRQPVQQARVPVNVQAIRQQAVLAGPQVAQALPQRNELTRQRAETRTQAPQPPAPSPAAAARELHRAPPSGAAPGKAPATAPVAAGAAASAFVRPNFRHEQSPKPAPAPTPAARVQQAAPGKTAPPPPPANPIARTQPQSTAPAVANPATRLPLAPPASQELQRQQESQRQQEAQRLQQRQQPEAQKSPQQEAQRLQLQQSQQRQQQEAQKSQQQEAQRLQLQQSQQRQQQEAQQRLQLQQSQQRQQQEAQQHQQQEAQKAQQQEAQKRQQQEAQQRQQQEAQQRLQLQQSQQRQQQEAQKSQQQEAQKRQQQELQQRQQQEAQRLQQLQKQPPQKEQSQKEKDKEKEKEKDDNKPR